MNLKGVAVAVVLVSTGVGFISGANKRPAGANLSDDDNVIVVPAGDAALAQARTRAMGTFDAFWARVENGEIGPDQGPTLKVAIPHAQGDEHMWMAQCKASDDARRFTCRSGNDGQYVDMKIGQRHEFDRADISDWMYFRDGMMYGGYSSRVLIETLPADQREQITAKMAPLPDE